MHYQPVNGQSSGCGLSRELKRQPAKQTEP